MNNDLISREALKKALNTEFKDHLLYLPIAFKDLIDNAPTVDIQPFAIVKFDKDELKRLVDERVIEPIKNGELVLQTDKRPQGEWVVDITTREVVCSCCRQSRRDTRTTHIFFCNHCGADMRGNNNETN